MKKEPTSLKENQPRPGVKPVRSRAARMGADSLETDRVDDIVDLILQDHRPLKNLIVTLKDEDLERPEKENALEEFVPLLTIHAKAEERALYVEMKEFPDLRCESFHGDTEHGIAAQLMQEINGAADDDEWNAKVTVLAELVEAHIREEEEKILEDVRERFDPVLRSEVGMEYTRLKNELDVLYRIIPRRRIAETRPRMN